MPRTGKNDERTEQVPHCDKKLTKAEPLHQTKPVRKLRVKVEAKLEKTIVDLEEKFGDNKDRLIHELGVHQIELETQNEELCRAQQELEDSRNRYSNLYDLAPVGYFTFDKNACVVEANLTGCQMLDIERAYLIKKPFHLYISEDCQDRFYLHRRQVFETDTRQSCEISLVTKDGEKLEVLLESVKAADADGNLTLFRTTITDITELNIAEKVRNLAKFPSENPYPILRIHKDGTILYANKASEPFLKAKNTAVGLPAPPEWHRLVKNALSSGQVIREENTLDERVFSLRAVPITENDYVNFYGTDITEQKIAQDEREITIKLLSLINSKNHIHDLMKLVTSLLKDWSGCEAVGIRLQNGEDFPYFETNGFPDEFIQAESKLCSLNELGEPLRDINGHVYLECMCGNIISGRFDPSKPFFTKHGSFWSNCTTALLASTTNADRMAKTRNRCNAAGYESVALVPLRIGGETFGLLQFNSKQKNKFTPEKISLLEHLADNLAIGLSQRKAEESLRRSETRYRALFGNMLNGFAYCRMIYEQGRPQDFIYLDVNESFEKLTGLKNVVGRKVTEVIPGIKEAEPELFEIYGRVALTGKPEQFEINFHPLKLWLSVSVYSPEKEHFVAIFENINERKKAEEALRKNREDLDRAQAVGNIGSWRMDILKNELTWSDENHRIFGIPKGTPMTYETFLSAVHPDDRDYVDKKWKAGLAGEDYDIEHRLLADGQVKWVREKAYLEFDDKGTLLGGFGITQDITERKQAEEQLRESEEKYRAVIEITDTGFVALDEQGRVLNANLNYAHMVGYFSIDKIVGRQVTEWTAPYDLERNRIEIRKCFEKGSVRNLEIDYQRTDGTIIPIEINATVLQTNNGKMILTLCRDITKRKRAEESLQESEEKYRSLFNNAEVGMFRSRLDGSEVLDVNDKYLLILGLTRAEFVGKPSVNIWDDPKEREEMVKTLKAHGHVDDLEFKLRNKAGEVRTCLTSLRLYPKIDILEGSVMDITERKRTEKSLIENNRLNQMLLDAMPCVALLMRPKSREIVALNKMAIEAGAVIGKTCFQTWARSQTPCPWCLAPETWATGQAKHLTVEHGGIWWDAHWLPIAEDLFMHYAFDVTKEKIAEQAILESEERLKAALNAAELGIWDWDLVSGQLKWEGHHARLFGFKEGEFDGRFEAFEKRVHPDDIAGLKAAVEKAKEEQTEYFCEYRVIWPDGTVRWLTGKGRCRYNQTGQAVRMLGTVQDITEHRQAEEALLASETRYRRLFEAARDGILILDADSGLIVDVNPFIEKMLGYSHEEFLNKHLWEIGLFKNIAASKEAFLELQDKGYVRYDNMPLKTKDGRQIAVEFVSNVYIVDHRKVIQCNIRDITERALTEKTLQISEIRFRELFNHMSSGVAVYDAVDDGNDFIIKDFNAAGEKMEKISRENIIGRKVTEVFPGVKPMGLLDVFSRVWRTGKPEHHPTALYKDDRLSSWRENYVYKLLSGEIVAAYDDVTERQTATEQLKEERNLLRNLIDHIPDGIYVKDNDSRFILYNKAVAEYWGTKGQTDLIGKTDFDILPQATAQSYLVEEQKIMSTNQPLIDREGTCTDSSGNLHHFLTTKMPLQDTHGKTIGIVGVNNDITTIKMFEAMLLDHQKQLKRLASRLITVEERERRRIATNIHDDISQTLAMAKIKLDKLRHSSLPETIASVIEEVTHFVEQVIHETRTLTFDLSNPILYELGFEVAVAEWLSENVGEKHGIATEFQDDGQPKPLDDDLKAMLFRNTRELLTNCIKHASAKNITVKIRRIDDSIQVIVEDNGVGFDLAQLRATASKKGKFGLFSIRENMENTGGSFEIESKPGAGCKAVMTAPLKNQNSNKET